MRVGLNMLHLVPNETGGSEVYARRLVPALREADPSVELVVFASGDAVRTLKSERWDVELVGLRFDARSRPRRALAEQTLLPRAIRRERLDLLHNLFSTAPAAPGVTQVTTIHDVIYKRFPETHGGVLAQGLAALVWLAARSSARVVAPSEAAKGDIVRYLGVPAAKVDVTYEAPGLDASRTTSTEEVRTKIGLGDGPVVLSVSAKRPHKNIDRLLDAFAKVRSNGLAPLLVVPGYSTFYEETLRERAGERVHLTGWLDDAELDALYRAATCFVFPSLAEGFGLPVLEALARGTPVACSSASSLPEVAGDAVLYFDPTDTAAITAAIERLLEDESLRARLREAGPRQAAKFSWDRTAAATLESYWKALGE